MEMNNDLLELVRQRTHAADQKRRGRYMQPRTHSQGHTKTRKLSIGDLIFGVMPDGFLKIGAVIEMSEDGNRASILFDPESRSGSAYSGVAKISTSRVSWENSIPEIDLEKSTGLVKL